MNTFGLRLKITTFGESHGALIGCVIDGLPAGVKIDEEFLQSEMDRRRPGKNRFSTQRDEGDIAEIVSGVFEGVSTGAPIGVIVRNSNQKSGDYENVKNIFRPGHADYTYIQKYGVRDYRGGGRSSARETAARVAAAALAKMMLRELGIDILSGVCAIGGVNGEKQDFGHAKNSEIFALDESRESEWMALIDDARNSHDSIGGAAAVKVVGAPAGLGEPMYHKLDSQLASAMMGINGVKAVEVGEGVNAAALKGSQNNDQISKNGFVSNHAGGILGGIGSGQDIELKVYFKPTPSIFLPQQTVDIEGSETTLNLKGRHDPCIAVRGSVVAEAMAALVVADMLLLNASSKMENLRKIYS